MEQQSDKSTKDSAPLGIKRCYWFGVGLKVSFSFAAGIKRKTSYKDLNMNLRRF